MNKNELVELIKEVLELKTKKEAVEYIDGFDLVVEAITEKLELEGKVKFGKFVTFEKKDVAEKEGEMTRVIDGVKTKTSYVSPARTEIVVKRTSALKSV